MRSRPWYLAPLIVVLGAGLAGCGKKDKKSSGSGNDQDPVEDPIDDCRVLGDCEVAPTLDRTVATTIPEAAAFLYQGENPLQRDVEEGAIERRRVAIVRGVVEDADGEPLLGAKVSVLGHPELGWTYSRADGSFDLAVNGGGRLVLTYEKLGHLPMQRAAQPGWWRYESVPTVALVERSEKVSQVSTDAGSLQIAEAEEFESEAGTRRPLVLFEAGTSATAHLPDGEEEALRSLSVRISEYPFQAPGEDGETFSRFSAGTPSTNGLSYGLAFSIDEAEVLGAQSVSFDKAVTVYTENFLELETGVEIPFGFYNRASGSWEQGRELLVVEVVDERDGHAELDVDGDGEADGDDVLDELGISASELEALASRYEPGDTLWRTEVTHFSEYQGDLPIVPPPRALAPSVTTRQLRPLATTSRRGLVRVESQAVSQSVSVLGTPYSLYYQSDRTASFGAAYTIDVPLLGEEIPEDLVGIQVIATVAGQRMAETLEPERDLVHSFEWDGRDAHGRLVQGQQRARVEVHYIYPGEIRLAKRDNTWSTASAPVGEWGARLTQTFELPIGTWDAGGYELGGFGLDVLHAYDPAHHTLHFGTGEAKYAENIALVVDLPAQGQDLGVPDSIGISPDGSAFVTDEEGRLLRIAPDEAVTVIAGDGAQGPAANWNLTNPQAIAFKSNGAIWVSDFDSASVWEIAHDGALRCILGSNQDDPMVETDFDSIEGIAFGPSEELYFVARPSIYRLRGETVEHFAGGGEAAGESVGDGGPATEAFLDVPSGIAVGADGVVYISERDGDRIRKVTPNGIISTYAGTGEAGLSGDGEQAAYAQIEQPRGLALGPDGTLYFADRSNNRIRMVSPEGRIQTLAGGGEAELEAGQLATSISIERPDGIAVGRDGTIWSSAESGLYRIRPGTSELEGGENLVPSQDGRTIFKFDQRGKHLSTIDAMTAVTLHEFEYDDEGLLSAITDRDGLETRIERMDRNINVIGPFEHETELTLDGARLEQVTDPIERTHKFEYDEESGLISAVVDAKEQATEFDYDANERLISVTDPTGYVETYERSNVPGGYSVGVRTASGKLTEYLVHSSGARSQDRSIIGPDGQPRTMSDDIMTQTLYHADGSQHYTALTADPAFGAQSVYAFFTQTATPLGRRFDVETYRNKELSDPENALSLQTWTETSVINGREYTAVYDRDAHTLTTTSPEGRVSVAEFDEKGRPVSRKDPGIALRTWTFDDYGRPLSMRTGDEGSGRQNINVLSFDAYGYIERQANALGEVTEWTRDAVGRIEERIRPDGLAVLSTWDDNDNVLSIQAPERDEYVLGYTDAGLLQTTTPPAIDGQNIGQVTYGYNGDNQLTSIFNADGREIQFAYDSSGRLDTTTIGGTTLRNFYDSAGRVVTASRTGSTTVNRTFDGPLWLGDDWGPSRSVKFAYDNNFWMTSLTVNSALTTHFTRDDDGLLTRARVLTNEMDVFRDPETGSVTDTQLANVDTYLDYNQFGERSLVGAITPELSFSQSLQRDDLGRVTELTETVGGVETIYSFAYDELGRLTGYSRNDENYSYTYDANGNRLSYEAPELPLTEGSYDEQDRIQSWGEWTYSYTEQGDLVQRDNGNLFITLQYDALGNLLDAELGDSESVITVDYQVDAMGRRITRTSSSGSEHSWVYQDSLRPVGEVANGVFTQYVYTDEGLGGAPDFMVRSATGDVYRLIKDHIGSVRFVVDAFSGEVVQQIDYDPFGRVLDDTNPGFQPFGFAGGLYDWETKLVRFGARDYDPGVGRWTAKDFIGFAGGQENLYVYAGGDPVNFVDPTGKFGLPGVMIGAAAGGLMAAWNGGDSRDIAAAMVGGAVAGAFGGAPLIAGLVGTATGAIVEAAVAGRGIRPYSTGAKSVAAGLLAAGVDYAVDRITRIDAAGDAAAAFILGANTGLNASVAPWFDELPGPTCEIPGTMRSDVEILWCE